jgi:hypothetical protein
MVGKELGPEGWCFEIEEISMGAYRLRAKHSSGANIELNGLDPDALIENARDAAQSMNVRIIGEG